MLGIIGGPGVPGMHRHPDTRQVPPYGESRDGQRSRAGPLKMGRNDGDLKERPEHQVRVESFQMDKTEVTNAEYFEFVQSRRIFRTPNHWVEGKPLGRILEMKPVGFVSFADAEAFAKWRSERDGVTYRLPTEAEWEYAARNGEKDNLYPWGNIPDQR